jgi:CRP-like cAMP-binding protein
MSEPNGQHVRCAYCPLKQFSYFRGFSQEELDFLTAFKTGELMANAGSTILVEGSHSAHLYTLLSGAAFRYKMLEDGRRQIMNFVFPGDIIGLQGSVMGEMQHSVEILSPTRLCVFERDRLLELYERHSSLGFDITWMAAREERLLDENLLNVGRRTALERTAYLIANLFLRAKAVGLVKGNRLNVPITQLHLADTLGLSVVHTNRTLKRLSERRLVRWRDRGCEVLNEEGLLALAEWEGLHDAPRPYL